MATTSTAGNTDHMKLVVCMCVIMYVCTLIISVSGVSAAPSGTKAVPSVTVNIAGIV